MALALASASSFSLASTLATFFARVPLFTPCEYCRGRRAWGLVSRYRLQPHARGFRIQVGLRWVSGQGNKHEHASMRHLCRCRKTSLAASSRVCSPLTCARVRILQSSFHTWAGRACTALYLHGGGPPGGLLRGADGQAGVVATEEIPSKEERREEGGAEENQRLEATERTISVGDRLQTHVELRLGLRVEREAGKAPGRGERTIRQRRLRPSLCLRLRHRPSHAPESHARPPPCPQPATHHT